MSCLACILLGVLDPDVGTRPPALPVSSPPYATAPSRVHGARPHSRNGCASNPEGPLAPAPRTDDAAGPPPGVQAVGTRMRRSPRARVVASMLATVVALGVVAGPALAVVNSVFPSTNDANRSLGWAHVNQVSVGDGAMTLEVVNPRGFASCFEFRSDGDTSQAPWRRELQPRRDRRALPVRLRQQRDPAADARRGALRGGPPGLRRRDRRAVRLDAVRPRPRPGDRRPTARMAAGQTTGSATRGCASRSSRRAATRGRPATGSHPRPGTHGTGTRRPGPPYRFSVSLGRPGGLFWGQSQARRGGVRPSPQVGRLSAPRAMAQSLR